MPLQVDPSSRAYESEVVCMWYCSLIVLKIKHFLLLHTDFSPFLISVDLFLCFNTGPIPSDKMLWDVFSKFGHLVSRRRCIPSWNELFSFLLFQLELDAGDGIFEIATTAFGALNCCLSKLGLVVWIA